jgi:hypothetical protein
MKGSTLNSTGLSYLNWKVYIISMVIADNKVTLNNVTIIFNFEKIKYSGFNKLF